MSEYAGKERRKQEPYWPWWREVEWGIVAMVVAIVGLIVTLVLALSYEARFSRNFTVGCTEAGGIVVSLDHVPSCVTVTPVPAQVTR